METIQVVMEDRLLRRVDQAARRLRVSRSALVRKALRQHLGDLPASEREEADPRGHERIPDEAEDLPARNRVLMWPRD